MPQHRRLDTRRLPCAEHAAGAGRSDVENAKPDRARRPTSMRSTVDATAPSTSENAEPRRAPRSYRTAGLAASPSGGRRADRVRSRATPERATTLVRVAVARAAQPAGVGFGELRGSTAPYQWKSVADRVEAETVPQLASTSSARARHLAHVRGAAPRSASSISCSGVDRDAPASRNAASGMASCPVPHPRSRSAAVAPSPARPARRLTSSSRIPGPEPRVVRRAVPRKSDTRHSTPPRIRVLWGRALQRDENTR